MACTTRIMPVSNILPLMFSPRCLRKCWILNIYKYINTIVFQDVFYGTHGKHIFVIIRNKYLGVEHGLVKTNILIDMKDVRFVIWYHNNRCATRHFQRTIIHPCLNALSFTKIN